MAGLSVVAVGPHGFALGRAQGIALIGPIFFERRAAPFHQFASLAIGAARIALIERFAYTCLLGDLRTVFFDVEQDIFVAAPQAGFFFATAGFRAPRCASQSVFGAENFVEHKAHVQDLTVVDGDGHETIAGQQPPSQFEARVDHVEPCGVKAALLVDVCCNVGCWPLRVGCRAHGERI